MTDVVSDFLKYTASDPSLSAKVQAIFGESYQLVAAANAAQVGQSVLRTNEINAKASRDIMERLSDLSQDTPFAFNSRDIVVASAPLDDAQLDLVAGGFNLFDTFEAMYPTTGKFLRNNVDTFKMIGQEAAHYAAEGVALVGTALASGEFSLIPKTVDKLTGRS